MLSVKRDVPLSVFLSDLIAVPGSRESVAKSRHHAAGGTVRISITGAGGPRDKLQTTLLRTQRFRRSLYPLYLVPHLVFGSLYTPLLALWYLSFVYGVKTLSFPPFSDSSLSKLWNYPSVNTIVVSISNFLSRDMYYEYHLDSSLFAHIRAMCTSRNLKSIRYICFE